MNTAAIIIYTLIVAIAVIIIGGTYMYKSGTALMGSRLSVFMKLAEAAAVLLLSAGLILQQFDFSQKEKTETVEQTFSLIDRSLMLIVDIMYSYRNDCPNFVCEMWPQLKKHCPKGKKRDNPIAVMALAMHILQSFEDHFTASAFDDTGEIVWSANYLQWASSKTLYDMWQKLAPNFKKSTNDYAQLLFKYAQDSDIEDAQQLYKVAFKMTNDPKLKAAKLLSQGEAGGISVDHINK